MRIARISAITVAAALAFTGLAACGKTTVEGPAGQKLTIVKPADQTVKQGETNKVTITVNRTGFDAPVQIEVRDLPSGVSVAGGNTLTIPTDDNLVTVTLVAAADAPPTGDVRASVTARGLNGMAATEFFNVRVAAR
ncbi:MAG TPA: hypothetical protein VEI02_10960 [Planctomycetota bacterium]|nr:hypothetical protein [Planctomycetota bacterium]